MRTAVLIIAAASAAACVRYAGSARNASPQTVSGPGWLKITDVPLVMQQEEADCGAAAIAMVVSYWTGAEPGAIVSAVGPVPERGLKAGRLRDFARRRGLEAFLFKGEVSDLEHEIRNGRPVLVGLAKPTNRKRIVLTHYEVVVAYHPAKRVVVTLDPAEGWRQNSLSGFLEEWRPTGRLSLVVSGR